MSDGPARTRSPPKKVQEDSMDWLEMATASKTPERQPDKTPASVKPAEPAVVTKPKSDPSSWLGLSEDKADKATVKHAEQKPLITTKPKSDPSDWLGLKDDEDDDDEMDYLKASSFSAPAKQVQSRVSVARLEFWNNLESCLGSDRAHPAISH